MAYEIAGFMLPYEAGSDLSSDQYKLVVVATDGQIDVDTSNSVGDSTDRPIGVLQNKPTAQGEEASVMLKGVSKAIAGVTIAIGELVTPSEVTDGRLDVAGASTDTILGMCLEGGAAGETIVVRLFGGPGGSIA